MQLRQASDFRPPLLVRSLCTLAVRCRLPHQPEYGRSVGRADRAGPSFSYVTAFFAIPPFCTPSTFFPAAM